MGYRLHERRAADRPSNGDTAVCPQCRIGIIEFNERYRVRLATGKTAAIPAWVCDRPDCHYERAARSETDRILARNESAGLRSRSNRPLLKARHALNRAQRSLTKAVRSKKQR